MSVVARLLIGLLFAAAPPATAAASLAANDSAAAATAITEGHRAAALRLAQTVQPKPLVIEAASKGFGVGIEALAKPGTEFHVMEQRFPGFLQEFVGKSSPILAAELEQRLPNLWTGMSEIYAVEMSPAEIEAATAFFASPGGQKFLRVSNLEGSIDSIMESVDETGEISARAHENATSSGASRAMAELSGPELAALARFLQEHQSLLARVSPKIMAVTLEWMNAPLSSQAQEKISAIYLELLEQRAVSTAE